MDKYIHRIGKALFVSNRHHLNVDLIIEKIRVVRKLDHTKSFQWSYSIGFLLMNLSANNVLFSTIFTANKMHTYSFCSDILSSIICKYFMAKKCFSLQRDNNFLRSFLKNERQIEHYDCCFLHATSNQRTISFMSMESVKLYVYMVFRWVLVAAF